MTPNGSLRTLVLRRRRRWLVARGVESALVACGVAALTLAAARLSGAEFSASAGVAAGLCALFAGASLLRERWRTEAQFTRRFDARVAADGAIVTACEGARSSPDDALVRLLMERTLSALDSARLARASSPPSPLCAAFALAGLAILTGVAELRADAGHAPLWAALAEVEACVGSGSPSGSPELDQALAALASARPGAGLAAAEERELEQRLQAALAAAGDPAQGTRAIPGGQPPQPGPRGSADSSSRSGGPAAPAGAASRAGSSEPTLAAGPSVRTMSRPLSPAPMPTSPPDAPQPTPAAAGTVGRAAGPRGRFWPRRHDAIVAGYVEQSPRD